MIWAANAVRAARHKRVLIIEAMRGARSRARLVTAAGLKPAW
jgi:hypothetical protein